MPEAATDNDYELSYRVIKMAIEQVTRGKNNKPHPYQFGHLPGYRYQAFYANTAGNPTDAVAAVAKLYRQHRIRHILGPYSRKEAEAVADWAATAMSNTVHISFTADNAALSDKTRFPNLLRICYTDAMYMTSLTKGFAARNWNKIVSSL